MVNSGRLMSIVIIVLAITFVITGLSSFVGYITTSETPTLYTSKATVIKKHETPETFWNSAGYYLKLELDNKESLVSKVILNKYIDFEIDDELYVLLDSDKTHVEEYFKTEAELNNYIKSIDSNLFKIESVK